VRRTSSFSCKFLTDADCIKGRKAPGKKSKALVLQAAIDDAGGVLPRAGAGGAMSVVGLMHAGCTSGSARGVLPAKAALSSIETLWPAGASEARCGWPGEDRGYHRSGPFWLAASSPAPAGRRGGHRPSGPLASTKFFTTGQAAQLAPAHAPCASPIKNTGLPPHRQAPVPGAVSAQLPHTATLVPVVS
jgi:hypothetical protein